MTDGIFDFHFRFGDTAVFVQKRSHTCTRVQHSMFTTLYQHLWSRTFFLLRNKKRFACASCTSAVPNNSSCGHFCSRIARCAFLVYCCRETRIMSVLAKVCFNCQTTNNYKKNRVLIQGIVDFPCTNLP